MRYVLGYSTNYTSERKGGVGRGGSTESRGSYRCCLADSLRLLIYIKPQENGRGYVLKLRQARGPRTRLSQLISRLTIGISGAQDTA